MSTKSFRSGPLSIGVIFITLLCVALRATAQDEHGHRDIPERLRGTWTVASVLIDKNARRHQTYQADDSRLVGRGVWIGEDEIKTDTPEAHRCREPRLRKEHRTAEDLVGRTMAGDGLGEGTSRTESYVFPTSSLASFDAYWVECRSGRFGPRWRRKGDTADKKTGGTWIAQLSDDKLAVRWFDQTILILRRGP